MTGSVKFWLGLAVVCARQDFHQLCEAEEALERLQKTYKKRSLKNTIQYLEAASWRACDIWYDLQTTYNQLYKDNENAV